jgi:hypothetical protein
VTETRRGAGSAAEWSATVSYRGPAAEGQRLSLLPPDGRCLATVGIVHLDLILVRRPVDDGANWLCRRRRDIAALCAGGVRAPLDRQLLPMGRPRAAEFASGRRHRGRLCARGDASPSRGR